MGANRITPNAVRRTGDTMTGDLTLQSADSDNGTKRLNLQTYEETGTSDYTENIRIDALADSAKGAIAFRDKNSVTQTWLQQHDYLYFYDTKTVDSVDDPGNTFGVLSHGLPTGWQVQLTTTGTLPTGLSISTDYYVRAVNSNTLTFFPTSADAVANTNKITFTGTGSGTIQVVPDNTYNFNRHKHFGIEVSDSSGSKQTRLSIPYGFDTTEMTVYDANLNVAGNFLRIWGDSGTNRQIIFAKSPADPDSFLPPLDTSISRWSILANNTAESGSNVGTDFKISRFNDSGAFVDSPFFIQRSTGYIGIGGQSAPTHALTLSSSSTGIAIYNTADQTTNYERGIMAISGNVITFYSQNAGSGTQRNIRFGDSTNYLEDAPAAASGSPKFTITRTATSSASLLLLNHAGMTGSSGVQYGLNLTQVVNQTSTAGYDAIAVAVTETGTGSGVKTLINATVGGNLKFRVNNQGVVFPVALATASAPTYVLGGMYFDTTLNKLRIGGATAWETVTSV